MILVDTSIWIDHLHHAEPGLVAHLDRDEVVTHDAVIQELALGSLAQRDVVLGALGALRRLPSLSSDELVEFVERRRLWGRGLSAADVQLLGAVVLVPGVRLWTRHKRLQAAATEFGVNLASP